MNKQEIFATLASVLDKQDMFFTSLSDYEKKHGMLPEKYHKDIKTMAAYKEWKEFGNWRQNKTCMKLLKKTTNRLYKNNKKHD